MSFIDQVNNYVVGLMTHGYNNPISLMSKGLITSIEYSVEPETGGGAGYVGGVKFKPLTYDDAKDQIKKELDNVKGKLREIIVNVDTAKLQKKNVTITVEQIKLDITAELIARYGENIKVEIKIQKMN